MSATTSRPTVVREFNLGEWHKGPANYFGTAPAWWRPEHEILRGIDNLTYDVQAMIAAAAWGAQPKGLPLAELA